MTEMAAPLFDQLFDYRTLLLARLESQPAAVAARLAGIPEPAWYWPHGPDGRSLHRLAAHVRDVESLDYLPRLRRILSEERPILETLPAHDGPDSDYWPSEPMTHILAGWSQARAEVFDLLPKPAGAAWSRTGFYAPSGLRTLQWWVERVYRHAWQHLLAADGAAYQRA